MENGFTGWQVILAWMAILAPIVVFDISAMKWGVDTSGDRGGKNYLEV